MLNIYYIICPYDMINLTGYKREITQTFSFMKSNIRGGNINIIFDVRF